MKKTAKKFANTQKKLYLCTRLTAHEVDSLAQQVEHIPFKDGVLGSSPKRITERRDSFESLLFFTHTTIPQHFHLSSLCCITTTLFPMEGLECSGGILP